MQSSWAFSGIISEKKIRKHSYYTAQWLFPRSRTSPGFSLFPPFTYLPETPFPGCWPSQFASSLSKHFTGERLDLHPPHCQPPHSGTRAYTHTHKPVHNYTQRRDRLKPALVLTTKISFSRMQTRQTSCHIWVTRLSVD